MSLNTIDGVKNTAQPLINKAFRLDVKMREKQLKMKLISESPENRMFKRKDLKLSEESKNQILLEKKKIIHQNTCFRFKLMRVRMKISYQAFQNRMTISEHMLKTILNSYELLSLSGSIPKIA